MQKRKFGNTGLETTLLGFGGFHLLEIPAKQSDELLNAYLDAGGNYIETAASYGNGESERKIGRIMKTRRSECILATKCGKRTKDECAASIELSLKNLQTDSVDLLIMHGVGSMEDLDTILSENGAIHAALEAKKQGKVKHIGISAHGHPHVLIEALKRYDFAAVMATINYYDRCNFPEIEQTLIPLANEKGAAIILMKPLADGMLYRSVDPAFRYALTQPVSVVVTGMNTMEMLKADFEAIEQPPLTDADLSELMKSAPELGSYVCRQCGACKTACPQGIDLPELFRMEGIFDRQMRDGIIRDTAEFALRDRLRFWFGQQELAIGQYAALSTKADACTGCGACSGCCPYGIDIENKVSIAGYKLGKKEIY